MEKKIIDVSYAQGKIDWKKAKGEIDGAILRCGYGANIISQDDDQWLRNVAECERLGIPYGVYLYSYAGGTDGARSEAAHAIRLLKGHEPQMPVYFDSEQPGTQGVARACAQVFYDELKKAGYTCGLYASESWYNSFLRGLTFDSLWIARYNTNNGLKGRAPDIGREYDMWQYCSVGKVSGIRGNVDMNVLYRDFAAVPDNAPSEAVNDTGLRYRAHVQKYGWLPDVHDGMIAGTVGESRRLEALMIDPPEGVELEVDVHLQTVGWKTYKGIKHGNARVLGTTGEGRRMEAIRIRCTKNKLKKDLHYQAHVQTYGWKAPVDEGEEAGTTGLSKRLEAVKIWMD